MMLNIDAIQNGIVIDHITAGTGMALYQLLNLDKLDCSIAVIRNARSGKNGKKDIIKIEGVDLHLDLDVLGYLDPTITVNVIRDGKIAEKKYPEHPQRLLNVVQCHNPRCITSIESEIDHIFELTPTGKYRCIYCEEELQVPNN